jgi:hypothetical protein
MFPSKKNSSSKLHMLFAPRGCVTSNCFRNYIFVGAVGCLIQSLPKSKDIRHSDHSFHFSPANRDTPHVQVLQICYRLQPATHFHLDTKGLTAATQMTCNYNIIDCKANTWLISRLYYSMPEKIYQAKQ